MPQTTQTQPAQPSGPLGACTVKLAGNVLQLRFGTKGLYALSKITGESPFAVVTKLQDAFSKGQEQLGAGLCDLTLAVPMLLAGLAESPLYSHKNINSAQAKIEKLLDAQAKQDNTSVLIVAGQTVAAMLPAFIEAVGGPQASASLKQESEGEAGGKGNE